MSDGALELQYERLLDVFDQTWREAPTPPELQSFVKDAQRQGVESPGFLRELVLIDMEYRWRYPDRARQSPLAGVIGECPQAEDYARIFPKLRELEELRQEAARLQARFGGPAGLAGPRVPSLDPGFEEKHASRKRLEESDAIATAIPEGSTVPDHDVFPAPSGSVHPVNDPVAMGLHPADPRLKSGLMAHFNADSIVRDRYRREELLGSGAFGEVWRATDVALQRRVAIKSLLASNSSNESMSRMLYEAQAAAAVKHPHLITVYDVILDTDGLHLVMEWAAGESFDVWMKGEPTRDRWIAALLSVAEALQQVHQAGLVHCDIKPQNILVEASGYSRLTDFGLAVREHSQRALSGKLFGTPAYLSPEQVRGESHRLDGRADIWAMGVVLYKALTGRLPFQGNTQGELFDEIEFHAVRPPRQFDASIPESLEQVCLRCLRKNLDERFATASDLAKALAPFAHRVESSDRSMSARLPTAGDRIIGRDAIAVSVLQLLHQPPQRMVTITGPGGMGKTRLASELAARLAPDFQDHVYWVELAEARDAASICRAVRASLGLPPPLGNESPDQIADALQLREATLLVLDNCEQVLEPLAGIVAKWLTSVKQLKVLATSQARLGIGGEHRVVLEPLAVPPLSLQESSDDVNWRDYGAVELFAVRAEQAGRALEDNRETWIAVGDICRRLEGLPLAIELAAARAPLLGVQGILQKLRQSLDVLRSTRRDLPARQQTLDAAVEWSVSLLSRAERQALAVLAMLPAPAPMELIEPLVAVQIEEPEGAFERLQELEERSLLRRREEADGVWLDVLGAMKRSEKLKTLLEMPGWAPRGAEMAKAMIAYYRSHSSPTDLEARDSVASNLWAACRWALAGGLRVEAALAARLADDVVADHLAAPVRVERLQSVVDELGATFDAALGLALADAHRAAGDGNAAHDLASRVLDSAVDDPHASASARCLMAEVLFDRGEYDLAKGFLQQARASFMERSEHAGAARTMALQGRLAWRTGHLLEAHEHFETALQHAARVADPALRSALIRDQGNVLLLHGKPQEALERFLRAERLATQARDRRAVLKAVTSHAAALAELGSFAEADKLYARAEQLSRLLGDRRGLAMVLNNRGLALIDQGLNEAALVILQGAEKIYRQIGHSAGQAICLAAQGAAHLGLDSPRAALDCFDRALQYQSSVAGSLHEAVIRTDRGAALRLCGDSEGSRSELGIAEQLLHQLEAWKTAEGFLCRAEQALLAGTPDAKQAVLAFARECGLAQNHPRLRIRSAFHRLTS